MSQFKNPRRIQRLYDIIQNRSLTPQQVKDTVLSDIRNGNKKLYKALMAGQEVNVFKSTEEDDDTDVIEYKFPTGNIVSKSYVWQDDEDFPGNFNELCANVVTSHMVYEKKCIHFVHMYDVFIHGDEVFMIFERVDGILDDIDEYLEDQDVVREIMFQIAYAISIMQKEFELVHFDLRHDNCFVAASDKKHVIQLGTFRHEYELVVKIGDFGQCEMKIGNGRPASLEIDRPNNDEEEWGIYPVEFEKCRTYDIQYFIYTLPDILSNGYGQYFYLDSIRRLIDEGCEDGLCERMAELSLKGEIPESTKYNGIMTESQARPLILTTKTMKKIFTEIVKLFNE